MNKHKPISKLTAEEQAMHDAIDWDSAQPVTTKERARLKQIGRNTTAKNKTITIRLSERNLTRLKAAAAREGVPYQTLVSSLIHKNV